MARRVNCKSLNPVRRQGNFDCFSAIGMDHRRNNHFSFRFKRTQNGPIAPPILSCTGAAQAYLFYSFVIRAPILQPTIDLDSYVLV